MKGSTKLYENSGQHQRGIKGKIKEKNKTKIKTKMAGRTDKNKSVISLTNLV